MSPLAASILAAIAFVGTHFLLSHPLRDPLAARLGERAFQLLYTVVAIATFAWLVIAHRAVPAGPLWWSAPDWAWWLGGAVMLFASVLLVGSFVGNPALPGMPRKSAARAPSGVFAITRHPMMWSFALWGIVHFALWPTAANLVLDAAVVFLALAGAAGQDHKKARLMGEAWRGWVANTAFVPFSRGAAWPGTAVVASGVALWLLASWAHGWLGVPGLWSH